MEGGHKKGGGWGEGSHTLRFVFDLLVTVKSQVSVSFLTAKPSAGEGGGGDRGGSGGGGQQIEEEMDK